MSYLRMRHILGSTRKPLQVITPIREVEDRFENLPLMAMSKLTRNLLCEVDYVKPLERPRENFSFLQEHLGPQNLEFLNKPGGMFCYPLYALQGDALRRLLGEERIYIPTLWSTVLEDVDAAETEKNFARNILPLPIDQRYAVEDMERILQAVHTAGAFI